MSEKIDQVMKAIKEDNLLTLISDKQMVGVFYEGKPIIISMKDNMYSDRVGEITFGQIAVTESWESAESLMDVLKVAFCKKGIRIDKKIVSFINDEFSTYCDTQDLCCA